MTHRVVTVAQDGCLLLDVAIPVHVFGHHGGKRYQHMLVGDRGHVRTSTGLPLGTEGGLDGLESADTVVVPGYIDAARRPSGRLLERLGAAAHRGVRLVSICTGAFTLAWAGLLDGRRVTTHWVSCPQLAELFPTVEVDPGVLYIDDGAVLTSAGVAAGLDLCLHIVRRDHGAEAAAEIARHTVVALHREGGQSQFIRRPLPPARAETSLAPTMAWAADHLDQRLDLGRLAGHAGMAVRTFARRFRADTGMTPLQWVLSQRVSEARRLLETTTLPVETIAHRCGFLDGAALRRHFTRRTGTPPHAYRVAFSTRPSSGLTQDDSAA